MTGEILSTRDYNLHSHTQYCDGRAPMEEMAAAAVKAGLRLYGFSPHSPISVESPCNMKREDVEPYLKEADRIAEMYQGKVRFFKSMEVDFISADFGPHIDYFQKLPLDYIIGSVHFVPTQDGVPLDCDGKFERFSMYLRDGFNGDLRYVVEKYFEQVLLMLERGGFHILGHFDKIAGNACCADPAIENEHWYESLVDDVISHSVGAGIAVEINTKSIFDKKRFFPADKWWRKVLAAGLPIVVNSDAHYPEKVNLGRKEAFSLLDSIKD